MRRLVLAMLAGGLLAAVPVDAQSPAAGSGTSTGKPAVEVSDAMIAAARQIGMAALKPGVSVSDRNIAQSDTGAYNVTVAFVTRPATTVPSGRVLSHDKITEIYIVTRGSGTSVTGTLVKGTHESGSTTIGPGFGSATAIENGKTVTLTAGEMQIIPPGLGHVWSAIAEGGIDYMVIRVDPDRVTALSK